MFEKEAEDYAIRECCTTCKNINHFCKEKCECWTFAKKGAEFGYNKANKWHDLRKDPNDLPDNGRRVLIKDKSRREYDVACLCRSKGNSDFWSYERFISRVSDNYVIAWCELPKFEE